MSRCRGQCLAAQAMQGARKSVGRRWGTARVSGWVMGCGKERARRLRLPAWLPLQLRRRLLKKAAQRPSNVPGSHDTCCLGCGGLDVGITWALPLPRMKHGSLNPWNAPRVCLLAPDDTCSMPVSRTRTTQPDCRCSGEAAHAQSDGTLRGAHTPVRDVRCGHRHRTSRQCRAFATAMFQVST